MFFLTYLRRELRHRLRQTIVTAVGLALGVALVIVVTALSSGVRNAQSDVLGALYGVGTDITVTTATGPGSGMSGAGQITPGSHSDVLDSPTQGPIDAATVSKISQLPNVAAAAGGLVLTDIKTTIPTAGAPGTSFRPPTQISVIGVDLNHPGLGSLSTATLADGRALKRSDEDTNVALIDSAYAAANRLSVGSTVTLADKTFTVIGIIRQTQGNPPNVYIPLQRAQAFGTVGGRSLNDQVNVIYVTASSAAAVDSVSSEIARLMPTATVTNSASLANGIAGSLATTAKLAHTLGIWLAIIALLAAFAVASLLTLAAVSRRAREFGTLKALGWSSRRITAQVMGESIAMGIAGAALGIALGLGGTLLAPTFAHGLSATVQTSNTGEDSFGGDLGAGGAIFSATVGGSAQTVANPNATHTVTVPFSTPVTMTMIVLAVILAIAGALVAGSFGGWRVSRLRPAAALTRIA